MIFKETSKKVLSGDKTQARRLVKPGERSRTFLGGKWPHAVDSSTFHQKWRVGNTYAVQPGHGQKAVGRVRITAIRRERLQEISQEDAIAEGFWKPSKWECTNHTTFFSALWQGSHAKPGTRWEDNPEVWVLDFELVSSE